MHETNHAQTPSRSWSPALMVAVCAAVVLCVVDAAILRADTAQSAGLGYLIYSVAVFGCALPFFFQSRRAAGSLRARWLLMSIATATSASGFALACFDSFYPTHTFTRIVQVTCFTSSESMYLLAAVLFFSNVGRTVVIMDTLQVFVFFLLRFNLSYSPSTWDHFYVGHLVVGQLIASFLFLIALVACTGASSRGELRFLQTLSWFFGLRFLGFFVSDQVSYVWFGHIHSSMWDAVDTSLFVGFALYLHFFRSAAMSVADIPLSRQPSIPVRNLMPSFLAFVNVLLGLVVLHMLPITGSVALVLTVVFYMVRTTLFQSQTANERARLVTHNEQLQELATRDPLTGCGNRRSLADTFSDLRRAPQAGAFALLLMDIDHFKEANDRFGHIHGDGILIMLAQKLDELAERTTGAHCARFGGDEFALLLPGVTLRQASAIAEQLRTAFASHRFIDIDSEATLSVGIAVSEQGAKGSLDELIAAADDALYRAKLAGRNCVAAA